MSNPRIKDLRYVEKLPAREPRSVYRTKNKRAWQKEKAKKEMARKREEEKRWANYKTWAEQWADAVEWADGEFKYFLKRSGRKVRLDRRHYHMERKGQNVLDVAAEAAPKRGRGWMNILPAPEGRHPFLNQEQLRKICKTLGVSYYREMSTDEQRAALIILANMDGIDPKRDVIEI